MSHLLFAPQSYGKFVATKMQMLPAGSFFCQRNCLFFVLFAIFAASNTKTTEL